MNFRLRDDAEECCRWCRRPADMCRSAACDDTPTYLGVLRGGEWVEAEGETASPAPSYQ